MKFKDLEKMISVNKVRKNLYFKKQSAQELIDCCNRRKK